MTATLPLAAPSFDEREVEAAAEVVRSGWLTMGPRVADFESDFSDLVGTEYAVMVSSCTAALHLAFAALDLGPGDEVIVPSLTFVATANAVAYTGATPRFADIVSLDRPQIDPEHVRALISPRTSAICTVHFAGYMSDVEVLRDISDRHGLALVEDAAHAPGAETASGASSGSVGDIGCFSFFSNKNLVAGEGGVLTTDDERIASRVRRLRAHGMTATSWDRERGRATGYDVVERGFNYRPSEIEAAIAHVQLEKLPVMTARRRELVSLYRDAISRSGSGRIPFVDEDERSACHILPLVCESQEERDRLRERADRASVQTSVHYSPVHRFSVFGHQPSLPRTEEFAEREVTLPLYPGMNSADVARAAAVTTELVPA